MLEYDSLGVFAGAHLAAAVDVAYCRRLWRAAVKHSVSLNEYLVSTEVKLPRQ